MIAPGVITHPIRNILSGQKQEIGPHSGNPGVFHSSSFLFPRLYPVWNLLFTFADEVDIDAFR